MVQINFGQREVSCKVVFYGPGMSGKTTNLEIIHKKAPKDAVGEMVSIATETDRTLYFDFLPLDLGQVAGMRTKFQLYTVPGQIYYNATRKLVLQGVDGVIFVADSNPDKMAENLESFQNLRDNLAEMGLTVDDIPVVLQYNKRDLPNALSVPDLDAQMNPNGYPTYEACARDGKGVFATLKEISRLVIEKLNKEHAPAANRRRTASNLPPAQAQGATPVPAPAAIPVAPVPAPAQPSAPAPAAPAPMPPRPAPPAARPMAPTPGPRPSLPAAPAPTAAVRPVPPNPAANRKPAGTPSGAQVQLDDPKFKHLNKAKPPALDHRGAGGPDVGATDPNLRKYQDRRAGGGGAMKALLGIVIVLIVLVVLILFVRPIRDAVRPFFPKGIQELLMDEPVQAPIAAPTPVQSAPVPAVTQAPPATPIPAAAAPETKAP
jgi:signal recognition particle receptor subunit beta/Na+-transporting methylmalonyl-CoA/oxaloacetate decarboxylase gamma subunit